MAKQLQNFEISNIDFVFGNKAADKKILLYKKAFKLTETKKNINKTTRKRSEVPLWEKATLTLEEAAEFSGIGIHKIRELTDSKNCKFVLWNGNRRLIKRKKFEEFIDESFSI